MKSPSFFVKRVDFVQEYSDINGFTLPTQMRAILVLRYLEDLPEAEVAAIVGCSMGSVKSQASRGLSRLRSVLQRAEGQPLPTEVRQ